MTTTNLPASNGAAPNYTAEQRKAVETRAVSVSLSAGAGCGKTFVLTERFLSHFDPRDSNAIKPQDLSHLVAITFTERAAREMRERIRRKCYDRLAAAPPNEAPYWAELLRALDNARISTIHSFCASLLRSRAVEAGLDPQFGVLDQAQAQTLLSESVDDEIRRLISLRDETTIELAVQFGLDGLGSMLRFFVEQCTPQEFAEWLAVSPEEQVQRWQRFFEELRPLLARNFAASPTARLASETLKDNEPANAVMQQRKVDLLAALEQLAAGADGGATFAEALDSVANNARVQGAGAAKVWPTAEAYTTFKDAATKLREEAGKLRAFAEFDPRQAHRAAVVGGQLLAAADLVRQAYTARKTELRVLDFNDLMSRARQLLTDPRHAAVRKQLGEQISVLLVDEFQDTDPLQVELVEALCGDRIEDGKLFFVGDYKQSIYRFRGADPHVFRRLRERTPAAGQQLLSLNFRSQPAILEFVNGLFWNDLGANYEPLRPFREQVSPVPAVEFLWAAPTEDCKEYRDAMRQREADWIARRLRAMLDDKEKIVWDQNAKGSPSARTARFGDMAILFRALTNVDAYENALRDYGIDYYLVGGHAFYAQQEIFDLLNLLRAVNSPVDLVSLIGVLRSGMFALQDETIFWLAQNKLGLFVGLHGGNYPHEIPPEEQRKAARAAKVLSQLRASKDRLRVCELIDLALELTGYDAVLLGEFLGERKLANLLKLRERARDFQRGDILGLADYIAQLSDFVAKQPDEPLAATHAEGANVVRLMSIHQSKGLEFPIVVVPDLGRTQQNSAGRVQFDPRLGPLVRPPSTGDAEQAMSGIDLHWQSEKIEEAAEMNRLLYVASTRAADYLLLSSGVKQVGEASGPWMELLARRFDLTTGKFLGHLPATESTPQVRVTVEKPTASRPGSTRKARTDVAQLIAEVEQAAGTMPADRHGIEALPVDASARRQYSFSRLEGKLHEKYERLDDGVLQSESAIDPRGLGTLVHAALAAIDFSEPTDCRALVARLAERHLPDRPAEAAEALEMIERFQKAPRARELARAANWHVEVEFLLGWPQVGTRSDILLRGFIDRLYQDSAGLWHVLDFKTNRVQQKNVALAAAGYEMQMLVYALATERLLGSPPASLTLHFLRTGAEHAFAWNDDARERVTALVERGIEALNAEVSGIAVGDSPR